MKTLGIDLGTNSIGWAIRNTTSDYKLQIEKSGVTIFEKGVGVGKSGEYSFAAERTKNRSVRRLNQSRKYRLWETLKILIVNGYCPLTMENLDRWRKYDKDKALKGEGGRAYPVDDILLDAWIKLDFDGDGKPDYTSPYQLRAELLEAKLDFNKDADRYKLGRALYHIAQRRGFKSSRKDAVVDDDGGRQDTKSELKKESEFENSLQKKFGKSLADFKTIGSALAFIEREGERIRLDWIQHTFRKHYKDECTSIFEFQGIGTNSELYKSLVETNKNRYNGSIFFQRPLRSQKGLIGKCSLEPQKYRCPISHPEFEEFRALSLINNIQYRSDNEAEWQILAEELKKEIYEKLFLRISKPNFQFNEIRLLIEKRVGKVFNYHDRTINYSDKTNISGCPVSARLKDIFGDEWKAFYKETEQVRRNGNNVIHKISYGIEDIWHVIFSFDDEEMVTQFAEQKLGLDETKTKKFLNAWKACPDGYAMLSLNVIKKINQFLREGFIYTEAVLLANIPEIIGAEIWNDKVNQKVIKDSIAQLISDNRQIKQLLGIVNNLVSRYKSLNDDEKYGYRDTTYILTESDKQDILTVIIEAFGEKKWKEKVPNKTDILNTINYLYQCTFRMGFETTLLGDDRYHIIKHNSHTFFKSTSHQFYKLPRVIDTLTDFIRTNFPTVTDNKLAKLYHPSMIEIYAHATPNESDGKLYLQDPKTGAFKNPMAMRALHELRKLVNYLIKTGQINDETRIVVETARELNDSNKRWAIEAYQRKRQIENAEFAIAIKGLLDNKDNTTTINPENSDDVDKVRLWYEQLNLASLVKGKGEYAQNKWTNQSTELIDELLQAKTSIDKYRLWNEQKCTCIYTGRIISLSNLFDENKVDFEHTIPRSISFDNSMANLTVCFADYNRNIKKNRIPTQLPNYENDANGYSAIKPRLKYWEEKIEHIKANVEYWKGRSKSASTKDFKDDAIRQRHLWQMELDYWQNKLDRFTRIEVTSGFKNSQLVDTQLISKYAIHYMRTAFSTVDVQKGTVTADFRKILGIQNLYEKKIRTKHSHHAIDAMVLTLIPHAAQREKILKLFYTAQEVKKLVNVSGGNEDYSQLISELNKEVSRLDLPNLNQIIEIIDSELLVNNIAKDNAVAPGKKIVRKRGRIVFLRDKNGKIILDSDGKPKPKIAEGDSIRGQLHLDTFYGKIKTVDRDINGKPLRNESGKWIYPQESEAYKFVVRKPTSSITQLDQLVDPELRKMILKQLDGRSLEKAFAEGVFMLNKNGIPVGNKIRHIRVWANITDPLPIKTQDYKSKHDYKNEYWSDNGENYAYGLYQNDEGVRGFQLLNLFNLSKIRKTVSSEKLENLFEPEIAIKKPKSLVILNAVLRVGQKVLFFKERREEIELLSLPELSNRLYVINGFGKDGRIRFTHHLDARDDKALKELESIYGKGIYQGFSTVNFKSPWPKLKLSKANLNFLVEGKDFDINRDSTLMFK